MTVILRTAARIVLPLMVLLALELHLAGHGNPGGGFIAGVLVASAVVMLLLAFGRDFVESNVLRERTTFYGLLSFGLVLAFLSAAAPLLMGEAFLTQNLYHVAGTELSSALFFDTGILVTVTGGVMLLISEVSGG